MRVAFITTSAILAAVLGLAAVRGLSADDGQDKSMTLRRLVIEGRDGSMRAELGTQEGPNGESIGLRMFDTKGNLRMNIQLTSDGSPLVTLMDASEAIMVTVAEAKRGHGVVTLAGDNSRIAFMADSGEARLKLQLGEEGEPSISLTDERGAIRQRIALTEKSP